MNAGVDQYGVFGYPVSHSLSPFVHAMFARESGQQISYRAYEVTPEDFNQRVRSFFAGGGRGLNITLPHKLAAVGVAAELSERATHAAAVNTLTQQGTALLGDNTDGAGLVRDLSDNVGLALEGRRVLILGAGGATRGIVGPLLALAPKVLVIANRTPERAAALAAAFADVGRTRGVSFQQVGDAPFDLIVNATSASLSGEIPQIPRRAIAAHTVCYDLAYGRSATAFVKWAQALGCARALQGLGMLVEQAAESFQIWRGVRPATAHVLAVLRERTGSL
ncbi:MAG: shikimate dehydrogenase [Gammaproteobacteria bacterium]|nr:shikimate dehydrogenase [Gammaproteobacteria bacterium]